MARLGTFLVGILLFALQSFSTGTQATTIEYSATRIAGKQWQYDFTVTNDTLTTNIQEFTIFFDLIKFENLSVAGSPSNWDSLVVQPDISLPDDGFFDSLAFDTGITPGLSRTGFSVLFDWLGLDSPGSQPFTVVDSTTLATVDSGTTCSPCGVTNPVSEPSLTWLLFLGIFVGVKTRFDRKTRHVLYRGWSTRLTFE